MIKVLKIIQDVGGFAVARFKQMTHISLTPNVKKQLVLEYNLSLISTSKIQLQLHRRVASRFLALLQKSQPAITLCCFRLPPDGEEQACQLSYPDRSSLDSCCPLGNRVRITQRTIRYAGFSRTKPFLPPPGDLQNNSVPAPPRQRANTSSCSTFAPLLHFWQREYFLFIF